jgi:DNA-binding MarR family transcriptional regulator
VAGVDDESLSELFWAAARQLRHGTRETLAPWDITPSHGRALGVLIRGGAMRLNELSEHLHIAARSTTEVVDALEQRGLVERQPDPADRRATLVAATAEGLNVGQAIRTARAADAEGFFATLSDTDRRQLARILRKLRT